jgi:hypothetical protein
MSVYFYELYNPQLNKVDNPTVLYNQRTPFGLVRDLFKCVQLVQYEFQGILIYQPRQVSKDC